MGYQRHALLLEPFTEFRLGGCCEGYFTVPVHSPTITVCCMMAFCGYYCRFLFNQINRTQSSQYDFWRWTLAVGACEQAFTPCPVLLWAVYLQWLYYMNFTGQFIQLYSCPIDYSMLLANILYATFCAVGGNFDYSVYVVSWKTNIPFCPELPTLFLTGPSGLLPCCSVLVFSMQPLTLMFLILEAFSYRPYFLNLLLFLWPSGTLAFWGAFFGRMIWYRVK